MLDIIEIRKSFPILERKIHNKPLIYLDNGATTQKPRSVIEAMVEEYYTVNSNVHRGVHYLSQQATELHEHSREVVRRFINAKSTEEIIFTRGTTESINLVANSFGETFLREGDEIIISTMEHHSNIVPWQLLEKRKGIKIKVIPINDKGEIIIDEYNKLFSPKTKLVSVTHISNVLGTINPIKEMIKTAHSYGVPFLVDAAQSVPHISLDVQDLDADFLVFSGHKVYAPTGVGVLYGKSELLNMMEPYQAGGEMIKTVSFEGTTFNDLPFKFEAGTPDYVGTTGLAKALEFVSAVGIENIAEHEHQLTQYAIERLTEIPNLHIIGQAKERSSVVSFIIDGIHHFDLGTLLDKLGIAVRTGHHCAQPLMKRLGIDGTTRASFAVYNTLDEVDQLVKGIERISKMF